MKTRVNFKGLSLFHCYLLRLCRSSGG